MFSHGYIKNDFDVDEWARPEFLEQGVREWLKEEWQTRSWQRMPEGLQLKLDKSARRG
jgi:hypothetical protein